MSKADESVKTLVCFLNMLFCIPFMMYRAFVFQTLWVWYRPIAYDFAFVQVMGLFCLHGLVTARYQIGSDKASNIDHFASVIFSPIVSTSCLVVGWLIHFWL